MLTLPIADVALVLLLRMRTLRFKRHCSTSAFDSRSARTLSSASPRSHRTVARARTRAHARWHAACVRACLQRHLVCMRCRAARAKLSRTLPVCAQNMVVVHIINTASACNAHENEVEDERSSDLAVVRSCDSSCENRCASTRTTHHSTPPKTISEDPRPRSTNVRPRARVRAGLRRRMACRTIRRSAT